VNEHTFGYDLGESNWNIDQSSYIEKRENELHWYATDSDNLNFLLSKYEELDQVLLEQLLVVNKKGQTPLHIALENHNHKSVSLILKKLGLVQQSSSKNFQKIFSELLDYDAFGEYLNECFF
jgi:ankyrin repeat protein